MSLLVEDEALATGQRWRARRLTAGFLRAFVFLIPMVVGFFAGWWAGDLMAEPVSLGGIVVWWGVVIATATLAANLTDRLARRLLPLTLLLRMTMLFPDKAPSRIRIARRTGNIAELRRRIADIHAGESTDVAEMSELILSLSTALSKHDRKTRGHSERTRTYTDMLAEEMGIPEEGRDKLRWAALLHDVGKLEVPVEILNKDGGLESEEWDLIRQHPINGMKLVAPLIPWLGDWAKTIEHHHERWDGTGYPHGLRGHDIFVGARIVAVADAYDVMTSGRVYQKAKPAAQARREVAEQAGRQFDPAVARALMNVSLGKLRWATGPLAMLAEIPFIRGLPQTGRDIAAVVTSSSMMAATLASGVVPIPPAVTPSSIIEAVSQEAYRDPIVVAAPGNGTGTGDVSTTGDPTPTTGPPAGPATTMTTAGPTTTSSDPTTTTTTTAAVVNGAPNLASVTGTTGAGELITLPLDATDPNGDQLTCSMTKPPSQGAATVPADCSRVTYQAPDGFEGEVTIEITVTDGSLTDKATASITVIMPNRPPVAVGDSASVVAGSSVTVSVLANDSDPDGDSLTVTGVTSPSVGTATRSASSVVYTAPSGASGTTTFDYTVCDPDGACDRATVTITIQSSVTANDDAASVRKGDVMVVPVLANDDPGGGTWDLSTLTIIAQPAHATVRVLGGGKLQVKADKNYEGPDSFRYRVCTTTGDCDTATVRLTII